MMKKKETAKEEKGKKEVKEKEEAEVVKAEEIVKKEEEVEKEVKKLAIDIEAWKPKTSLGQKVKSGEIKTMKNVALGDILENGSVVRATLKIKNYTPEDGRYRPLYSIPCRKLKTCIYVTGSHLIQHPKTGKFIPVAEFEDATVTNAESDKLSCLVTDDHLITIGEYTFWDWED